jgi:hypothetical protein
MRAVYFRAVIPWLKIMEELDIAECVKKIKFHLRDRKSTEHGYHFHGRSVMKTLFFTCCLPAQLSEFLAETITTRLRIGIVGNAAAAVNLSVILMPLSTTHGSAGAEKADKPNVMKYT